MRPFSATRLSQIITGHLLLLVFSFLLLVLLTHATVAAPLAPVAAPITLTATDEAAATEMISVAAQDGVKRGTHAHSRGNANYWRIKGDRMQVERKGLLGWLLPNRNRHQIAEKQRAEHRAPTREHYHHKTNTHRNQTFWQHIGFAD